MGLEIERVHPITAHWLQENGYQYEHEFWLPLRGRADFFAWNDNGDRLIVECEAGPNVIPGIGQVLAYCAQFDTPVTPVLAIPRNMASDYVKAKCAEQSVDLIELPIALHRIAIDVKDPLYATLCEVAKDRQCTITELVRSLVTEQIADYHRPKPK